MKRVILLSIWALLWGALPVSAQGTRPDTVLQKYVRQQLDSIARDKSAPQYSKRAQARIDSATKAHLAPTNRAPVAVFTYPLAGCKVGDICTFDASASTDDKAVVSYQWDCGVTPNCASTGKTASAVYTVAGTPAVTLRVTDAEGLSSTVQRSIPIVAPIIPPDTVTPPPDTGFAKRAELPRSTPVLTFAKAIRTITVTTDLQSALNAAQPGDSLVLTGTFTGNFVLPTRPCGAGITVVGAASLPIGRMRPSLAAPLAKLVTPNSSPALKTLNPTCGWRLAGLEVTGTTPTTTQQYGLLWLGDGGWVGGGETQTDTSKVPRQILLDRVYVHGSPTLNTTRCVYLNSASTIIRDSWISECHARGFDSQAILGCNGPGPYLIENNALSGSGENVMFGGCDPVNADLIPSDITIRGNHVFKDPAWRGVWTVKNLFELKNARRVLVENNVFENNWVDAQSGMAIIVKSSTETCAACTWEGSKDVTFRWNWVRNSPRGLNIQAIDGSSAGTTATHTERVTVTNSLFDQIGAEGDAWLMLLTHDLTDVVIDSSTFLHALPSRGNAITMDYGAGAARRLAFRNNIMTAGNVDNGSVIYSGGFYGTGALNKMVGDGSWVFSGNAIVGGSSIASLFPAGNTFPSTVPATPGVDRAELQRRTAGVVLTP